MEYIVLDKVYGSPLRWAGSKKKLLNEMLVMFDQDKKIYVEPFLGSGIVLINTLIYNLYDEYYVNDVNENIVNFFLDLKSNFDKLCNKIEHMVFDYNKLLSNESKALFFYDKRKQFNENRISPITRSAIFWFLMKTGYNGVYRINSHKKFNVPFGKKYKLYFDKEFFLKLSMEIQKVNFYCEDYQKFLLDIKQAKDIDQCFIYCDPPYIPETKSTKNQILYTAERFEHKNFLCFLEKNFLKECSVMVSMSKSKNSTELYKNYFKYCLKVNDIIRKVNPNKNLNSVEEGYLNYVYKDMQQDS